MRAGQLAQRLGGLLELGEPGHGDEGRRREPQRVLVMRAQRIAPAPSQRWPAISAPSTRTAASAGAIAAKNQVSKRFGAISGVIQREISTSPCGSRTSPASSAASRTAARRASSAGAAPAR